MKQDMKLAAALVVVLGSLVACVRATTVVGLEDDTEWHDYKSKYGKWYETSEAEETRYKIWKAHSELVDKHNKQADEGIFSFWLAMNEFADLSNREFVRIHNGFNNTMRRMRTYKPKSIFKRRKHNQVPDSIDWRDHGYVTEVKNQGMCGSCWAFSSTGALEGQHMKSTGQLTSLSEQNLVDCSGKYGNQGCNGGLMDQAFAYVKENNGIDTEASYPYTAHNQQCKFNPDAVGATDSGFVDVKTKDEKALKQAIGSIGPISVAIDASHITFQLYSHGVYHEFLCSSTRLDHGVLAVGYGTLKGKDYWIVKNSWGEKWGDKGYILMSRNRKNNCGIATAASYPLI